MRLPFRAFNSLPEAHLEDQPHSKSRKLNLPGRHAQKITPLGSQRSERPPDQITSKANCGCNREQSVHGHGGVVLCSLQTLKIS